MRAAHLALPTVAGALALALLISADADADTVLVADKAERSLAAHVDLTGGQYVNDRDGFSARLTVRDLKLRTETLGFTLTFPQPRRVFHVTTTRTKTGKQTYRVDREGVDGRLTRTCSSFTASWDDTRDRIDVHVPWACLGELRAAMKVQGRLEVGKTRRSEPAAAAHQDSLRMVKVRYR